MSLAPILSTGPSPEGSPAAGISRSLYSLTQHRQQPSGTARCAPCMSQEDIKQDEKPPSCFCLSACPDVKGLNALTGAFKSFNSVIKRYTEGRRCFSGGFNVFALFGIKLGRSGADLANFLCVNGNSFTPQHTCVVTTYTLTWTGDCRVDGVVLLATAAPIGAMRRDTDVCFDGM